MLKVFLQNYYTRHSHPANIILHIIGIPLVIIGVIQFFVSTWYWALLTIFLGLFFQWIGHILYDQSEMGEIVVMKKIIYFFKKMKKETISS